MKVGLHFLSRCALLVGLLCALVGGCHNSVQEVAPVAGTQLPPANSFAPQQGPSGISGYAAQIGFSAESLVLPVDSFTLIIKDAKGKMSIKRVRTNSGAFTVSLPPGHYTIIPKATGRAMDKNLSRKITVPTGNQTDFSFNFPF